MILALEKYQSQKRKVARSKPSAFLKPHFNYFINAAMLPALLLVKTNIFNPLSLNLSAYFQESEGAEYSACGFSLNQKSVKFRAAKTTPKKVGQFVTLWKRNIAGITVPFDENDEIDLVMIFANTETQKGLFVFPKALLIERKVISTSTIEGKRGFRLYPPWDNAPNKQATATQAWQVNYFMEFNTTDPIDQNFLAKLGLKKID
jgi:hypothetical protein